MSASAGFAPALEALAGHLRANAVRADVDPAKVNPPAVWVAFGEARPELLTGDGQVLANLYCLAPNVPYAAALVVLDALAGDVLDLVDTEGDILPATVVMPDGKVTLPAFRLQTLIPYARTETP